MIHLTNVLGEKMANLLKFQILFNWRGFWTMLDLEGEIVELRLSILPVGVTTSVIKRTHASHPSLFFSTGGHTPHRAKPISFF
jgi:hypothetical protein